MWILTVIALVIAVVALVVALLATRRARSGAGQRYEGADETTALPGDVQGLRQEVAALRAEGRDALRHLAVVRYDAFEDMGGHLSWSVALLDDSGHGVVLTSIHGRSEARTYAKSVQEWSSGQQLSPEETEAIENAKP